MRIVPEKNYKIHFRTFCNHCNNEIEEITLEDITIIKDCNYIYKFDKKRCYEIYLITCPNCKKIIKVSPFSSYLKSEELNEN